MRLFLFLTGALLFSGWPTLAKDFLMRADTGRPFAKNHGYYMDGPNFVPGKDATGLPYWSSLSNTVPRYILAREVASPAETLAFACRLSESRDDMPATWLMMACPNYNWAITNVAQASSNEFIVCDMNLMLGTSGGTSTDPDGACVMNSNWNYYAVAYEPASGQWTWWKNGQRAGAAIKGGTWTNGWQIGGCIMLRMMRLGGWNVQMDMDRMASWERKLTDVEVHQDYLSWYVSRFGATEDPPYTLTLSAADLPVAIPDTVTNVVSGDALLRKGTTSTTKHDKQVTVNVSRGYPCWGMAAAPTNVAVLDAAGRLTHVADGTAVVSLSATNNGGGYTSEHTLSVALATESVTSYAYTGGVAGSVRAACLDWMTPRLTNGVNLALFSTFDHTGTNYVWNTNCWSRGLDLTCISVWNSSQANAKFSPTLISPESAIGCNHAYPPTGSSVRWITAAGAVVERTITASVSALGAWPSHDVRVFRLSAPITNITPAALMPGSYTNLFALQTNGISPAYGVGLRGYGVPAVSSDQLRRATVRDVMQVANGTQYMQPIDTNRLAFFQNAISGDSGSPGFLIVSNMPVLLSVFTGGGAGTGPNLGYYYHAITNVARSMGDTNVISGFDFTGFSTY